MRRMPFSQPAVAADGSTATPSRTRRSNGPQAISACWYTRRPSPARRRTPRTTSRSSESDTSIADGSAPATSISTVRDGGGPSVRYTSTGARDSPCPRCGPG